MNRRLIFVLPVLVFVGLAVVLFRSLFLSPSIIPPVLINRPAPQLTLAALDADTQGFGPQELKAGKVVLINVFGSWCAECHIEAPVLMQLAAMSEKEGFEIYGFVQRDTPEKIRAFLGQTGNPFHRIGNDVDGRAGIEWGVYGAPETFLVDGKGVIRYKYTGALTPELVQRELLPAIRAARAG
jgi:cytochrome c biogenesis protein CcmG/thiol:disulfide interchange protein DsbE